jgi:hypothetical protein
MGKKDKTGWSVLREAGLDFRISRSRKQVARGFWGFLKECLAGDGRIMRFFH